MCQEKLCAVQPGRGLGPLAAACHSQMHSVGVAPLHRWSERCTPASQSSHAACALFCRRWWSSWRARRMPPCCSCSRPARRLRQRRQSARLGRRAGGTVRWWQHMARCTWWAGWAWRASPCWATASSLTKLGRWRLQVRGCYAGRRRCGVVLLVGVLPACALAGQAKRGRAGKR